MRMLMVSVARDVKNVGNVNLKTGGTMALVGSRWKNESSSSQNGGNFGGMKQATDC